MSSDDRKYRKPLMEKKRRARINESLDNLKQFLLERDPQSVSKKSAKLEKADILEMTVSYLHNITKTPAQQSASAYYQPPSSSFSYYPAQNKYCAQSFLSKNGNGGHVYYGGSSNSYSQKCGYSQQKYGEKEKIWRPW